MKKLSVADLIAKKELIEKKQNVTKEVYLDSMEGSIVVKKPSLELIFELNEQDLTNTELSKKLIYESVIEPNLKDPLLHDAYECKADPYSIVLKLFDESEFAAISDAIGSMGNDMSSEGLIEEIKKQ